MFKKNTAVTGFPFGLVSATDGSAITSGTITGYYLLDGGTQGTITDTPVHEGNGQWSVDLLAGEMNGDIVGLLFSGGGAVPVSFTIKTDTVLVSEVPTATENADALLNRDMSAVSDTNSRSPLNALRFLRNQWTVVGTTLTVYEEDDSTSAWTASLTTDANADPITGSNPAGGA